MIQPPPPLTYCKDESELDGPYWQDREGDYWARAAAFDANGNETTVDIEAYYFYHVRDYFDFPLNPEPPEVEECIPWLDMAYGLYFYAKRR
ncbi:hypothetical protein H8E77_42295 [bacterium]|nr:hypothetical protein [bacterium]